MACQRLKKTSRPVTRSCGRTIQCLCLVKKLQDRLNALAPETPPLRADHHGQFGQNTPLQTQGFLLLTRGIATLGLTTFIKKMAIDQSLVAKARFNPTAFKNVKYFNAIYVARVEVIMNVIRTFDPHAIARQQIEMCRHLIANRS